MRGNIDAWMKAAVRYPLLTPVQEIQLGNRVQQWVTDPKPTRRLERSGRKAKDRLICCNLRLVAAYALKQSNRIIKSNAIEMEDLLQAGTLGLDRAAMKYDPGTGYKFSTYAYWWVRQSVSRCVVENSNAIKIPSQANNIRSQWAKRPKGQSIEDFAGLIGRNTESVRSYLELCKRATVISSDIPCGDGENGEAIHLLDAIADPFTDPSVDANRRHLQSLIDDVREIDPKVIHIYERRELYGDKVKDVMREVDLTEKSLYQSISQLRTDLEGLLGLDIKEALAA